MAETETRLKQLSGVEQAVYFHARERRRSLAGVPELFQTHRFALIPDTIAANQFPVLDGLVTWTTAVRITGAAPTGLLFCLGDATTGIAAWIDDDEISFRAGDAADPDRAIATFTNAPGSLPVDLEVDLVFACRPGDGRVRIWANGREIARARQAAVAAGSFTIGLRYQIADLGLPTPTDFTLIGAASNTVGVEFTATGAGAGDGSALLLGLPNGWAASVAGVFAQAAAGALPADVTQTGAPVNFEVIEPLRVYVGSVPRHFI
jgi:hypothetical protein